jgi:hypothetical protein
MQYFLEFLRRIKVTNFLQASLLLRPTHIVSSGLLGIPVIQAQTQNESEVLSVQISRIILAAGFRGSIGNAQVALAVVTKE